MDLGSVWQWVNNEATPLQAVAALFQLVFAVVLISTTIYYQHQNRELTASTTELAQATDRLAQLTEEQRKDWTRPIVVFELEGNPFEMGFGVIVSNAGVGPAVDMEVDIAVPGMNYYLTLSAVFPLTLPAGSQQVVHFYWDDDSPFDAVDGLCLGMPKMG